MNPKRWVNEWIENIKPYKPGEIREGYIKLASNENNYGPSEKVIKEIKANLRLIRRYPYMDSKLKRKIAEYCSLSEENVILGNGSDELIDMILKTFRGNVASIFPTFLEYKICSQILNKRFYEVPLEEDFSFPLERFLEQVKAKDIGIIFIANPNNPTGRAIKLKKIKEILELEKIVVIDEAYFEFYGKSCVPLLEDYENLIVLRTFSKAFGLSGLRLGYALANKEVISYMNRVRQPFNTSILAQIAGISALEDLSYVERCVKAIKTDRERLYSFLKSLGIRVFKSEANFLLLDVSPYAASDIFNKLLERKIIVRKFGKFPGFNGEYIRISIGTRDEMNKLISALQDIFQSSGFI
ncbi:MAG TPA: histidinol-phosphate transaminase [Candidatus Altiarchaeales archaeon]|nr:histidinol-phosphate transaminase [Candidatus Altiarchaeales archaeon]